MDNFKFNYGILAVKKDCKAVKSPDDVLCFTGYIEPPTPADYESLYEELKTDDSLNTSIYDFKLIECPMELLCYYKILVSRAEEC